MLRFVLQRLAYALPIIVGVSLICFLLVHLAPGDPASALIPDDTPPEVAAQIRAAYGFDQPLPLQYLRWLGNVAGGDLGLSLSTRRPVIEEVLPAVANTLRLAFGAIVLACVAGVLLGTLAAYRAGRASDRAISAVGISGMSVPQYWLGIVLVIVFSVELGLLPATGMGDPDAGLATRWTHMILPTITLATVPAGVIARSVRSAVSEVLQQEYVQALEAKGLPSHWVVAHVAKNAAPALLAIIGLQFANLLGGSILVETIFAWPGSGYLLNSAIFLRDLPLMQGTVLVLALFFVLTNLAVDLLQMVLDPRMNSARRGSG
ncbi:ABC transporter permease [Salinarimonas sp. NSM]|uniref:ABC transporter permease n=1 Tax=Salinarimonas sp. NSM TaxID=3458003 RepID=UPI0040365ED7